MTAPETPPLSPNPFGADAPTVDRTVQAVWAMVTGAVAVVAWFAILTFLSTRMTAGLAVKSAADVNPNAPYVNFLAYGSVLGVAFGAVMAWVMMSGIPSSYRRGGLSLVSAFAGAVVAGLSTVVVKQIFGPPGLLGLAFAAVMLTLLLMQRTQRARVDA